MEQDMSDFLVELNQNRRAKRIIRSLGLPIPLPEKLRRETGAWQERPLADDLVVVGSTPGASFAPALARSLAAAGANTLVVGDDLAPFRDPGEAYGRPARQLNGSHGDVRAAALIFDASGIADPRGLGALYDFFHGLVGNLRTSGRVVVLARPLAEATTLAQAAAQRALEGFVKSLAREIGRRGATAQLVQVAQGADGRLDPVLRFLLSPRSAFVSGQAIAIDAGVAAPRMSPPLVRPLDGKVALVTGAARGIGRATAERLAAEGAHVVCLDRPADDQPLSQLARTIGGSVLLVDLANADAPARVVEGLKSGRHGARGLDVVVHNAGVTRDRTLARMSREEWDQALTINLAAVVELHQALVAGAMLRDEARVVCLSSVAGIAGNMGQTNYSASKAGLIGFVARAAAELAARGIAVNAVAPGFIETRLTAAIPAMVREVGRRLSSLGQGGLPGDVAEVITFLASPGAAGISGQVVRVCGGAMIGA
jgi:3-oxoacyl-[acyl-carrier protein] reductase